MSLIPEIYDYTDYREYLQFALASGNFGRGARQKLAEHLSCQPSFISQVLSGKNEFSLEHAFKVNNFVGHGPDEIEYFMTMVLLGKAGSEDLTRYYQNTLEGLKKKKYELSKLLPSAQLSDGDVNIYFGNWLAVSIHMLVSIPRYQDRNSLFQKLGGEQSEFDRTIGFLLKAGLIKESGLKLMTGENHVHLKKTSPNAQLASVLTRLRMIEKINRNVDESVNYSLNFTIGDRGMEELKKRIFEFIGELRPLIESEESTKFCTIILDLVQH